ncbi:MAG TPA: PKD domain-containing protein, partial [Cytophaga sp.]|nr:PKD domain-containing protein [Cytophaga sp.]
ELIVFASNINSEKNKMDLFISEYNDGIWSPAIAMSSKINDEANQIFPFINSKNILYYSSDKKTGKGGLDIYYTNLNSDTSSIKTFPFPINSSADDFGVWIDTTSETGYFSSNRNARYKDDIYYFSKRIPEFKNWKKINTKNTFCYNFYEERSLESKDTLDMVFEWDFGDGKKGRGLKIKHCFEKPGEYLIQLNTVNKVSGEVFVNETSSTLLIEKPDQLVIDCQDSINENQSLIIKTDNCYLKGYKLNEMYWSFGDGKYNSGPLVKHFYQTPGTYKIEVGLLAKNIDSDKIEKFKIEKNIIVVTKKK